MSYFISSRDISMKKILTYSISLCLLVLIVGVCGYCIGTFRNDYIHKYNNVATLWENKGLNEFKNQTFYVSNPISTRKLIESDSYTGDFFPVHDACNRTGDPSEGCYYTNTTYYTDDISITDDDSTITIMNAQNHTIFKKSFRKNMTYIMDKEELDCAYDLDNCINACNQNFGIWNYQQNVCHFNLFIHELCIRVRKEKGEWIVDEPMSTYPINSEFLFYDSDYHGCYYNNNWHSLVYAIGDHPFISVTIRSQEDSYLAASGYTKGCSSNSKVETSCFGKTHFEERFGWFMIIQVGAIGCIVWICVFICYIIHHYVLIYSCKKE